MPHGGVKTQDSCVLKANHFFKEIEYSLLFPPVSPSYTPLSPLCLYPALPPFCDQSVYGHFTPSDKSSKKWWCGMQRWNSHNPWVAKVTAPDHLRNGSHSKHPVRLGNYMLKKKEGGVELNTRLGTTSANGLDFSRNCASNLTVKTLSDLEITCWKGCGERGMGVEEECCK